MIWLSLSYWHIDHLYLCIRGGLGKGYGLWNYPTIGGRLYNLYSSWLVLHWKLSNPFKKLQSWQASLGNQSKYKPRENDHLFPVNWKFAISTYSFYLFCFFRFSLAFHHSWILNIPIYFLISVFHLLCKYRPFWRFSSMCCVYKSCRDCTFFAHKKDIDICIFFSKTCLQEARPDLYIGDIGSFRTILRYSAINSLWY